MQIEPVMNTDDLINEIERLPIDDRMLIIEKTIHSVREQNENRKLAKAARALVPEYLKNNNLTSFTALDFEEFYETK